MYEFRFYSVVPGRMAAELALIYDMAINGAPEQPGGPPGAGESLWQRYGVPRPLGVWTVSAGRNCPGLLYIIKWDSFTQRDAHFPRFWSDPSWRARRAAATDGSPLVDSIEDWVLAPSRAWAPLRRGGPPRPVGGLHELRIQALLNGAQAEAAAIFGGVDLPALQARGAEVLGVFEIVVGPGRPTLITLLAWPDFATQQQAWSDLDADPGLLEQRRRERDAYGRRLFGKVEQYLLDPLPWGLPSTNLGEPALGGQT